MLMKISFDKNFIKNHDLSLLINNNIMQFLSAFYYAFFLVGNCV